MLQFTYLSFGLFVIRTTQYRADVPEIYGWDTAGTRHHRWQYHQSHTSWLISRFGFPEQVTTEQVCNTMQFEPNIRKIHRPEEITVVPVPLSNELFRGTIS